MMVVMCSDGDSRVPMGFDGDGGDVLGFRLGRVAYSDDGDDVSGDGDDVSG
ncbi:hypothetical protein Tco_0437072, partial [Tanacetum coccineum]